jgi:hypothetical protein
LKYKPRQWQTMTAVKKLEKDIEQYFTQQEEKNRVPTIQGLCLHLDINVYLWEKYLYRRHPNPKRETILVQDLFERAKLYIEVALLNEGLDKNNKNVLWYLSHFKDFSGDYNPKQEFEIKQDKELSESEINAELLKLEQKEKDLRNVEKC